MAVREAKASRMSTDRMDRGSSEPSNSSSDGDDQPLLLQLNSGQQQIRKNASTSRSERLDQMQAFRAPRDGHYVEQPPEGGGVSKSGGTDILPSTQGSMEDPDDDRSLIVPPTAVQNPENVAAPAPAAAMTHIEKLRRGIEPQAEAETHCMKPRTSAAEFQPHDSVPWTTLGAEFQEGADGKAASFRREGAEKQQQLGSASQETPKAGPATQQSPPTWEAWATSQARSASPLEAGCQIIADSEGNDSPSSSSPSGYREAAISGLTGRSGSVGRKAGAANELRNAETLYKASADRKLLPSQSEPEENGALIYPAENIIPDSDEDSGV